MLGLAKRGVRIVNTARGGIIDEDALAWAITEGIVGGAALDVFAEEPTTSSPLFELDSVVVTPHLGASTREAQDKAGDTIAEQVMLALAGEFVPFAVNVSAAEASETVRPYLPLVERLGQLFAELDEGRADRARRRVPGRARRLRHAHPHALGAQGHVLGSARRTGHVRQRSADREGSRRRGPRGVDAAHDRLRQPHHAAQPAALDRRHARRPPRRAAARDDRRPQGRTCRPRVTCSSSATTIVPG